MPFRSPVHNMNASVLRRAQDSAEMKGPGNIFEDPAGSLRFRTGFGPNTVPSQAQNIRQGTHKPAHNDSERFWAEFCVFRRRSETFELQDSLAEMTRPWGTDVTRLSRLDNFDLSNTDFVEAALRPTPSPSKDGSGGYISNRTYRQKRPHWPS